METTEEIKKIVFRNVTNVKFQNLKNAISRDKERPNLKGVFLDMHHGVIVVTDSQIVMTYDIELIEENELKQILIDPKIFNQSNWISVPKDDLQLVEFHCTEEKTEVKLGEEVVAVAKNIETDNAFPNYRHVFSNPEETSKYCMNKEIAKRLFSAVPAIFEFPILEVGQKLLIYDSYDHHEVGEIKIKGIAMLAGFGEDEITNESVEFKLNRDKDGKIFSGEFKKVQGKKLSKRVLNCWNEDFADEDSGEVVSIERKEIIVDKNVIIDEEIWNLIDSVKTIDFIHLHKYDN